ncbi:MAG: hypothetical protein ABI883_04775, partial [Chthoniobacterales bacterium]
RLMRTCDPLPTGASRPTNFLTLGLISLVLSLAAIAHSEIRAETPSPSAVASAPYELGTVVSFATGGESKKFTQTGWGDAETEFTWTTGQSAKLLFKFAPSPEPLKLRMRLAGFLHPPGLTSQPVEILANSQKVAAWQVSGAAEFTATIPAALAQTGALNIEIKTPKAASPKALGVSDDARVLGVSCYEVELERAAP